MSTQDLFHDEIKETTDIGVSNWVSLERVLDRWRCLAAFGMVQAWVAQKLVNITFYFFNVLFDKYLRQFLVNDDLNLDRPDS